MAKGSLVAFCDAVYRNSLLPTPDRKHPGAEAARYAKLLARPTPAHLRDLAKLARRR